MKIIDITELIRNNSNINSYCFNPGIAKICSDSDSDTFIITYRDIQYNINN